MCFDLNYTDVITMEVLNLFILFLLLVKVELKPKQTFFLLIIYKYDVFYKLCGSIGFLRVLRFPLTSKKYSIKVGQLLQCTETQRLRANPSIRFMSFYYIIV